MSAFEIFALICIGCVLSLGIFWGAAMGFDNYVDESVNTRKKKRLIKKLNKVKAMSDEEKMEYGEEKIIKLKTNLDELIEMNKKPQETKPLGIGDIELTNKVKELIDDMIANETYSYLRSFVAIRQKYDITKLDVGIKEISNNVIEGINPALFKTEGLFYTPEYLMHYIVDKTYSVLLQTVESYNSELQTSDFVK
jgi:hypothetical protein